RTRRPAREAGTASEPLVGPVLARDTAGGERLLRGRRVRRAGRAARAGRAPRRGREPRRQGRAVGDGARLADAGLLAARHHGLLAADPQRLRAGGPPSAGGTAARTGPRRPAHLGRLVRRG